MTRDDAVSAVQETITSELYVEVPDPNLDLIEAGYLDSMDVVRLLTALESRYNIVIELDTLELTDIGSVESLADVVMARL